MGRSRLRRGLTQTGSDEGNKFTSRTSKQIEDYHSGGKRSFSYKKNDRGKVVKIPLMLVGGQAKLDKNKNNKIDAEDFKILKAEKAKGRGMGLQDEKVKPGKVMKARKGKLVPLKKDSTKPINPFAKQALDKGKKIIGKGGRIGAAAAMLGLAGAGAAKLGQTIGRKYFGDPTKGEKNKMSKPIKGKNKKMGGGMMQRPGYIEGGPVEESETHKMFMKYGKKKPKKMGGGMMKKYSKGGGADTGRVGELKSKIAVATDKLKKHFQKRKRRPDYIKPPERKSMIPADVAETARSVASFTPTGMGQQIAKKLTGKMGGGMMQKPMGYKSGTSVKVKCKLGRNKPTKMY